MENVMYCPYCKTEHVLSETLDNEGNVVGLFCHSERLLVKVLTPNWNSENILPYLKKFLEASVHTRALIRMDTDALRRLSKKMAYLFLRTNYGKKAYINYAFVEYHTHDVLLAMKEKAVNEHERV
jgi:hypothetical protein